jgi:hypothetical protein
MNCLADCSLAELLPPEPSRPLPPISFRTLNGYQFWPVPLPAGGEETEALRVRRAFAVEVPAGETHCCILEFTPLVRDLIRAETRREFRPTDDLWDTLCTGALSDYLWTRAMTPPAILTLSALSSEQLELVRALARRRPLACH